MTGDDAMTDPLDGIPKCPRCGARRLSATIQCCGGAKATDADFEKARRWLNIRSLENPILVLAELIAEGRGKPDAVFYRVVRDVDGRREWLHPRDSKYGWGLSVCGSAAWWDRGLALVYANMCGGRVVKVNWRGGRR